MQYKVQKSTDLGNGPNPYRQKIRDHFASNDPSKPVRSEEEKNAREQRAAQQGQIRQKYKTDSKKRIETMLNENVPTFMDKVLDSQNGPKSEFDHQRKNVNSDSFSSLLTTPFPL